MKTIPEKHRIAICEMNEAYLEKHNLIPPGKIVETRIRFLVDVYAKKDVYHNDPDSKLPNSDVLDLDAALSFREFYKDELTGVASGRIANLFERHFPTIHHVITYGYGEKSIDDAWTNFCRFGFGDKALKYIDLWLKSLGLRRGMNPPSKSKNHKPSPGDLLGPGHREL